MKSLTDRLDELDDLEYVILIMVAVIFFPITLIVATIYILIRLFDKEE